MLTTALSLLLFTAQPAWALEVVIPYRDNNHWVHQDDKAPLNKLTRDAASERATTFDFILPDGGADNPLYMDRLIILRDILKSRLKDGSIVFHQREGNTPANTITIRTAE